MTVGENIRRIRKEKGLSQKQLGELCIPKIAESTIRKYELNILNPKIETVERIANALQCPAYELRGMSKPLTTTDYIFNLFRPAPFNKLEKLLPDPQDDPNSYTEATKKLEKAVHKALDDPDGYMDATKKLEEAVYKALENPEIYIDVMTRLDKAVDKVLNNPDAYMDIPEDAEEENSKELDDLYKKKKEISLADIEHSFGKLNTNGKKEAAKRIEELTHLKQYTDK